MDEFPGNLPGNSHSAKMTKGPQTEKTEPENTETSTASAESPEPKKKVIQGRVTQRRKPLGTRVREMFAGDGQESFADHLINNVAVPMIKDMIISVVAQTLDGVKNGVEDRISGTSQSRTRTPSHATGRTHTNYSGFSSPPRRPTSRPASPASRITIRRSNQVQDIILETRADGDAILEELQAVIDSVGHCTMGDLYSYFDDIKQDQTHEGWGWDNIDEARVRRIATEEFLLVMPRPIDIRN